VIKQICQAYNLPSGKASDGSETGFPAQFWNSVDSIVAKTMVSLWRSLWSKYNEHFPPHVRKLWHHPKCPNSPPPQSPTPSAAASTSTDPHLSDLDKSPQTTATEESDEDAEDDEGEEEEDTRTCSCPQASRCFHLTGFDLLLDDKFNLHLLEVNNNPSMMCKIAHLDSTVKQGVFQSCLRIMRVLTEDQVTLRTTQRGKRHEFFDNLVPGNGTQLTQAERTCDLVMPGKLYGHLLRAMEPDLISTIDRL